MLASLISSKLSVFKRACLPLIFITPLVVYAAEDPLERLREGNQRYVTSTTVCHEDWAAKRMAVAQGQAPFAIIVTCSDSRVPAEIIFDQALGDLFVIRLAGNVVDDFAIGSIEYGTSILGAKFVLVLGHSNCGAVDAVLKGLKFDNHIQSILDRIKAAVSSTKSKKGDSLETAIKANVKNVRDSLRLSKPVLAKLVERGELRIVGGYYDLKSGKVELLDKP